ncbi:MAG: ribonuclease HI family protein [Acidobacteriota bacterium]
MITAYIDGGARGNPGPAGYGCFIVDAQGLPLAKLHGPLGTTTNNVAEYSGLIAALEWALERGHGRLHIKADSLLIVEQMKGNYRVKNEGLQPLWRRAQELAGRIGQVTYEHIPREQNAEADKLSNMGMDEN